MKTNTTRQPSAATEQNKEVQVKILGASRPVFLARTVLLASIGSLVASCAATSRPTSPVPLKQAPPKAVEVEDTEIEPEIPWQFDGFPAWRWMIAKAITIVIVCGAFSSCAELDRRIASYERVVNRAYGQTRRLEAAALAPVKAAKRFEGDVQRTKEEFQGL